jgi:Transposase IS66 family
LTAATRHSKTEPKPPEVGEEGRFGGAALVLGYIEARAQEQDVPADEASAVEHLRWRAKLEVTEKELSARLVELAEAKQEVFELRRSVDTLTAYNEKLQETIRTLEIGFRRHISERISPDQLRLALAAAEQDAPSSPSVQVPPQADGVNVPAPPDPAAAAGAAEAPSRSTEHAGAEQTPPGSEPKGQKRRNRHNHGRRRIVIIPKVVIETTPPEVLLKGLERFERVGAEDSSVIGHRRGGPIELVLRRPKYVLRSTRSEAAGVSHEQPSPVDAGEPASHEQPPPVAAPAVAHEGDDALVVQEHQALMVPADTGFKRSPFVDGAIVRFEPEPVDCGGEDGPVWIAPLPERPLDRSLADPSLLAHVLVCKLDYHTPYYRQEVGSARYGFRLGRANMARWQFDCGGLLMHIADAMWTEALTRSWFAMDATGTAIRAKEKYRYGHVFVLVAPGPRRRCLGQPQRAVRAGQGPRSRMLEPRAKAVRQGVPGRRGQRGGLPAPDHPSPVWRRGRGRPGQP